MKEYETRQRTFQVIKPDGEAIGSGGEPDKLYVE